MNPQQIAEAEALARRVARQRERDREATYHVPTGSKAEQDPQWCIEPHNSQRIPENTAPAPISSAKANRDLADDLLQAAREQIARQDAQRVRSDPGQERHIRRQIGARDRRRDDPQPEDRERLQELTREHHQRTGAAGRGG